MSLIFIFKDNIEIVMIILKNNLNRPSLFKPIKTKEKIIYE